MLGGHAHVLGGAKGGWLWIDLIGWHGGRGLLGRVGLVVVVAMLALGATSYQVNSWEWRR
jgi:hypothetical protein